MAYMICVVIVSALVLEGAALPVANIGQADQDRENVTSNTLRGLSANWSLDVAKNQTDKLVYPPAAMSAFSEGDIPAFFSVDSGKTAIYTWPHGVIPYQISGYFSFEERYKIKLAMEEFHKHTCIRFVPYLGRYKDYINIQSEPMGCKSIIGRQGGGGQLFNLQSPLCTNSIGTILHELMHAIGFYHEHCRPDRDNYININWGNVWQGQLSEFNIHHFPTFGFGYDYSSVMHYAARTFSTNGWDTIVPKARGVQLGGRSLSAGDIGRIRTMYNCDRSASQSNTLHQVYPSG